MEVQWVDCGPGCPYPDCLARQEQREAREAMAARTQDAIETHTHGPEYPPRPHSTSTATGRK